MKKLDIVNFRNDLYDTLATDTELPNDVDSKLGMLISKVHNVLNKHAPLSVKRIKHAQKPKWINSEILMLMKRRDTLKRLGLTNEYKFVRNLVINRIKLAKQKYYETCIIGARDDSRKLWKILKEYLDRRLLVFHRQCNEIITDTLEMAHIFSQNFATVASNLVNKNLWSTGNYKPSDRVC